MDPSQRSAQRPDGSNKGLHFHVSQLTLNPTTPSGVSSPFSGGSVAQPPTNSQASFQQHTNQNLEFRISSSSPTMAYESCRNLLPTFTATVEGNRREKEFFVELTMAATQPNTFVEFCTKMSPILEIGEFMEKSISIAPPTNPIIGKDRALKKDYFKTTQIVKPLDEDGTASFSNILPHVLSREIDPSIRFFLVFTLYERNSDGSCIKIATERTSSFAVHSKRDTRRKVVKSDKSAAQKRKIQFDLGVGAQPISSLHPAWPSLVNSKPFPGASLMPGSRTIGSFGSPAYQATELEPQQTGYCPSEILLSETSEVLSVASMDSIDNISRGGDSTVDSIDTLSRGDEKPDDILSRGGDDSISRSESVDHTIDAEEVSTSSVGIDRVPQSLFLHRCILLTVDSYIDNLAMLQNYADDLYGKISQLHQASYIGLEFLRSLWASLDVSFLPPELLQRIFSRIACFSLLFLQNLFPNMLEWPIEADLARYPLIVTTILCMDPDLNIIANAKQLRSQLKFTNLNHVVLRSLADKNFLSLRRNEHIKSVLGQIAPFVESGAEGY